MVSASNVTPWHGLGTVVADALTAPDALRLAKLDWEVLQESVFDGDMDEIGDYVLNRRSDTREVLAVVNRGWTPVQNDRLLEIAEALVQTDVGDYRPVIETAGSLRGGRIVWALVRVGERKFADSEHHSYLLLSNSHDGSRAVRGTLTDVRVVCKNTMRLAETGGSRLYVSHTRGVEARLNTAIETLGWANDATRSTFAIYEALATTPVTLDRARAGFRSLMGGDDISKRGAQNVDRMVDLFRTGAGNSGRNAFDFVNAVTDWADHDKNYREDEGTAERRFLSSNFGGAADTLKTEAFRMARNLISA